jgi:hypothetical protein
MNLSHQMINNNNITLFITYLKPSSTTPSGQLAGASHVRPARASLVPSSFLILIERMYHWSRVPSSFLILIEGCITGCALTDEGDFLPAQFPIRQQENNCFHCSCRLLEAREHVGRQLWDAASIFSRPYTPLRPPTT